MQSKLATAKGEVPLSAHASQSLLSILFVIEKVWYYAAETYIKTAPIYSTISEEEARARAENVIKCIFTLPNTTLCFTQK